MAAVLKRIKDEPIKDLSVFAIFGHYFKTVKQVHDFQFGVIREYIRIKNHCDSSIENVSDNDESISMYNTVIDIIRNVISENPEAVSMDDAVSLFLAESSIIRNELYELLVIVAGIDGFFDKGEAAFFENVNAMINGSELYSKATESGEKQAKRIRRLFKKDSSRFRTGRRSSATDNLFRISQEEYLQTIERCRAVARKNFKLIKPICDDTVNAAESLVNMLSNRIILLKENTQKQEVADNLSAFSKVIMESILESAREYNETLNYKEVAAEDFTIVLVGRTKAGKSTLKAVLTGTDKGEIGKGKQRTTLINYIYEWNNIRIIDTPGIGAGEDDTGVDKIIAEKALSQADVVCYLSPSDGVPKDTKQFIEEIAYSNKPVLILVNYKYNLRDEDNFEDFLDDPLEWKSDRGSNSLSGYFNPIMREAETNGYQKMVSYYPVFLLAALMADEEKYAEYSHILRKNSGVDEFLASLKIIVVEQGTFLRSKTIIDDTIHNCTKWLNSFSSSLQSVKHSLVSLKKARISVKSKINIAQKKLLKNTEKAIQSHFSTLAVHHAKRFAEIHYAKKSGLDVAWRDYCKKLNFEESIKKDIEVELSEFYKNLINIFDDLAVDMDFELSGFISAKFSKFNMALFPAREVIRFLGDGLGLAGAIVIAVSASNPVGWVLAGASLLVTGVSFLFKKRADREKSAQDKLYRKLNEEINKQAKKTIDQILKGVKKDTDEVITKVITVYDDLQLELTSIINESDLLCRQWEDHIEKMNLAFAESIIKYVSSDQSAKVLSVDRVYGEYITIKVKSKCNLDSSKLEGLIREQVVFEYE